MLGVHPAVLCPTAFLTKLMSNWASFSANRRKHARISESQLSSSSSLISSVKSSANGDDTCTATKRPRISLVYGNCAQPTKQIAIDCEMVGVGENGKRSALARVSIVNLFGHILLDVYVRVPERIVDFRTAISGIRRKDVVSGIEFADAQGRVAELLEGRILVGHTLKSDLKVAPHSPTSGGMVAK